MLLSLSIQAGLALSASWGHPEVLQRPRYRMGFAASRWIVLVGLWAIKKDKFDGLDGMQETAEYIHLHDLH